MARTRTRSRARKAAEVVVLVLGLLLGGVPSARASIWTGSCPVRVVFSFNSKVGSAASLSAPTYSANISNLLGVPCAVSLDLSQPLRQTSGGGSGSSALWTCEATLGHGSWSQGWGPGFPAVFGSHVITGTWGAWTMVVNSPSLNFAGVIELTTSPFDAAALAACELGGISWLEMWGVMVFQDPELPGGQSFSRA